MHRTTITALLLASALSLGATGCAAFTVKTPEGFVSLERYKTRTYYKAVSPDNAVITVTAFKHKDKGSLDFWSAILKREMVLQKGYALKGSGAVRTAAGLEGRQLSFLAKNGTSSFKYEATLFITRGYIYVIEAAAKAKRFKAHRGSVDALIASFRP